MLADPLGQEGNAMIDYQASGGGRPDIPALTGLRFFAAFSVVVAHGTVQLLKFEEPPTLIQWLPNMANRANCFLRIGYRIFLESMSRGVMKNIPAIPGNTPTRGCKESSLAISISIPLTTKRRNSEQFDCVL